jgi:hypothetical protein
MGEYQRIVDNHEWFNEHIGYLYTWFIMDETRCPKDEKDLELVKEFVGFCKQQTSEAVETPRGREATSYLQRAEAEKVQEEYVAYSLPFEFIPKKNIIGDVGMCRRCFHRTWKDEPCPTCTGKTDTEVDEILRNLPKAG